MKQFGSITIGRIKQLFEPKKFVNYSGHTFLNPKGKDLIVVDFGGNYGNFAYDVNLNNNCVRYVCVEPDPEMVVALKKKLFKFEYVELVNCAVGLDAKDVSFFVAKSTAANSLIKDFADHQEIVREIKVDSFSLDSFFDKYKLDSVDWLKVDIEGSEWDLLLGAREENLLKCKEISVEFHNFLDIWNNDYFTKTQQVINRLYKLGFRPYIFAHDYLDVLFVRKDVSQ